MGLLSSVLLLRYARRIELLFVVWLLSIAVVVVTAVGLGRMAWRILSGREEFEPGGSIGRQTIGRYHEDREARAHRRGRWRRRLSRLARTS